MTQATALAFPEENLVGWEHTDRNLIATAHRATSGTALTSFDLQLPALL